MFDVRVADDVLTAQPNGFSEFPGVFSGWRGDVCFLVSPIAAGGGADLSDFAAAARAAVDRFRFVTERGVELPGAWAVFDDDVPNGFVGPCRFEDGVVVGAVGEDAIWPAQAATMLRILLGELHSRKASARVSCPPPGVDVWDLPPWSPVDESPSNGSGRANDDTRKRWFVLRTVRSVTTTGVPYHDLEWLQPDGSWSRDKSAGMSFGDSANDRAKVTELVIRLRAEAPTADRDLRMGEVNSVLTSPDRQAESVRLPPDSIRDHGHIWREPTAQD